MSYTVEIKNTSLEMIVVTDDVVEADSTAMLVLYNAVQEWDKICELSEISLSRDGMDPLAYAYLVELATSEVCDEMWLFADSDDLNPMVTIALPNAWMESMIDFGAVMRHLLGALRARFGLVSFNAEFL